MCTHQTQQTELWDPSDRDNRATMPWLQTEVFPAAWQSPKMGDKEA